MTIPQNPNVSALVGALVADAATLGLHWIYDPLRIAEACASAPAFTPIDAKHYHGVPSYFAHGARKDGDLSQYGEVLALAMRSIGDEGRFDQTVFQDAYLAHFGPGGSYVGYIDRPTRGTLDNLAADKRNPSGVEDDQLPALATLPAVVARYRKDAAFQTQVHSAIRVTNVDKTAEHYGRIFANMLDDVLSGTALRDALARTALEDPLLQASLDTPETNSVTYGETTGRACHLHQGMPLAFHILKHATSYASAIETNILAGGDSCGRAIIIGSLAGSAFGLNAIPLEWTLATNNAAAFLTAAEKIVSLSE
ncbi:ADP-ribosylglycohydrolase family protein [Planktotalea sp.]|uniref:ADP-ribosylglycohydrolase family protein n=1 Tax=Planktotalea sp. TaxID=2029877 RepID=UPI003D6A3D73